MELKKPDMAISQARYVELHRYWIVWLTMPICWRSCRTCHRSLPKRIRLVCSLYSGWISSLITCTKVLFPAPFGPMMATCSLLKTENETSSKIAVPCRRTVACSRRMISSIKILHGDYSTVEVFCQRQGCLCIGCDCIFIRIVVHDLLLQGGQCYQYQSHSQVCLPILKSFAKICVIL